jgi:hypothetical protein
LLRVIFQLVWYELDSNSQRLQTETDLSILHDKIPFLHSCSGPNAEQWNQIAIRWCQQTIILVDPKHIYIIVKCKQFLTQHAKGRHGY